MASQRVSTGDGGGGRGRRLRRRRPSRDGARATGRARTKRAAIGADTIVMLGDSITEEGDWDALLPTVADRQSRTLGVHDRAVAGRGRGRSRRTGRARCSSSRARMTSATDIHRRGPLTGWARSSTGSAGMPRTRLSCCRRSCRDRMPAMPCGRPISRSGNWHPSGTCRCSICTRHSTTAPGRCAPRRRRDGVHLAPAGYRRWAAELERGAASAAFELTDDG